MDMNLQRYAVVFMFLVETSCFVMEARKLEIILGEGAQCVLDTMPYAYMQGLQVFTNNYMINISSQWDPLNPHDYLMWPVYDGPEAWTASCHFSGAIKQCLEPILKYGRKLPKSKINQDYAILISALFFMTLCEHQDTLADPRTNNAECIHQRMLSDDVLRCQGMLTWFRGNPALIENINYPHKIYKWYTNTASSINECIYKRGNWKHSCGSEVEAMMGNLTKSFSNLHRSTITVIYSLSMFETIMCDICKPGSDLTKYHKLYYMWFKLLNRLMYENQSPYLFRQCNVANYPLNQCHLRLMWRRDVYAMFCHQVRSVIVPVFTPHLPLCNFGDWVSSAARICNMGYRRFMDTASHIAQCTKDRDELFLCYKGLYMN